ncbi:MAG: hypothetical protein ACOC8E_04280 [Planctomycetota bacterium]
MTLLRNVLVMMVVATTVLGAATVYAQDEGATEPENKVDELYAQALKQVEAGKDEEAKATLNELLKLEPGHQKAQALLENVQARIQVNKEAAPEAQKVMEDILKAKRVREQYEQLLAEHIFKGAKKSFEARRYEEAERDLRKVIDLNPTHQEARELLARVREVLQQDEAGGTRILDRARERQRVWETYELARMRRMIDEGRTLLGNDQFGEAESKLRQARNSAEVLAAYRDVRREKTRIQSLMSQLDKERMETRRQAEREKLARARELAERERERLGELREERIERLFGDAKRLFELTRYNLAAKKAAEVLKIDPRNEDVKEFMDQCHQRQVKKRKEWYERTKEVETEKTWREVATLSIPFSGWEPIYPDNWEEIRKRRARYEVGGEVAPPEPWRKALETKLEKPVSFDFIATPLQDVIAFLRGQREVNIILDEKAVEGRDLDVSLELDRVRFKDALDWILRLVNLEYTLDNGTIYISTGERIQKIRKTDTRYYDVSDLTIKINDFKPNLQALTQEGGMEDEGIADIFAEEDVGEEEGQPDTFTGQELVDFIKRVIAPGTWEAGGEAERGLNF